MSELRFKSPTELQIELGRRLRQLRLHRNIDQRTLAEKAGIAFQLTNILRDLGEDASRGRVYLRCAEHVP